MSAPEDTKAPTADLEWFRAYIGADVLEEMVAAQALGTRLVARARHLSCDDSGIESLCIRMLAKVERIARWTVQADAAVATGKLPGREVRRSRRIRVNLEQYDRIREMEARLEKLRHVEANLPLVESWLTEHNRKREAQFWRLQAAKEKATAKAVAKLTAKKPAKRRAA